MTKAKLALRVVTQLQEDWEDGIPFPPSAWDNLEGYLAEHLDEALNEEADNYQCHETLAHEIVYEFNLISSYMGANRTLSLPDGKPDTSWDREIAHQAGMGGLSATDYAGEE